MASMNKAFILGRLGRDPELKTTQNGQTVCAFSMATDESYTDRNGGTQKKTTWHRIVVWGKQADPCSRFLHKGSTALVEGSIDTREYEDRNGDKKTAFEIKAVRVQFLDPKDGGNREDDRRDDRREDDRRSRDDRDRRDDRREDRRDDRRRDERRGSESAFDDVPF